MASSYNSSFWTKQYNKLQVWAEDKGFGVSCYTDAEDRLEFEDKSIHINSRQHAESRFYTLLHECGHLLISQTATQFQKDHPVYAMSYDIRRSRSKAYQVSLVAEEIEAWKRGRRLAKRMGFYVDNIKFDKIMTDCVMSYIADAAVIAG